MKKFIPIWIGEFISSIGTGMTSFALSVYVYQVYGNASAVSLVTLLAYLPTILLNPIGGLLADRYDRRVMMICGDLFSAFGLVFILFQMQFGNIELWMICVGVTISSVFASLLNPAYKATITDLLTEDEYSKASSLVQIASSAQFLISPFIAGILLGFSDIRLILLIDICTIFVTVTTIFVVNKHVKTKPVKKDEFHPLKELGEGWKCVTQNSGVRILIILMAFACFNVGFLQTMMSPMILSFASSKVLGYLESISAIGMLIGSIIIGIFSIKKKYRFIMSVFLVLNGISMAAMGVTTNIIFIIVSGISFFITLPFVNVCADTLVRINIPNELQGRAWGVIGILSQLGYVISYGISGVLADYIFCPLLEEDGPLANSLGNIIGTGEGRGIGLMLIICGILIIVVAFGIYKSKSLKVLENVNSDVEKIAD